MVRAIHKLKAISAEKATKPGLYGDGGGLYLQITKDGIKSWLFRFMINGRARGMGLGPLHTISLAQAREKAHECRSFLLKGLDPLDEKQKSQAVAKEQEAEAKAKIDAAVPPATPRGKTFKDCAEELIKSKETGWRNEKHKDQWRNTLAKYAYPVIGDLAVSTIETAHIMQILSPIWAEKTETASRVRGRIESVLSYAKVFGYRTAENPARWKGHLDHLLPKESAVTTVKHHPALPYKELPEFMEKLREKESIAAFALELLILTATRSNETRSCRWDEFDLEEKIWIIPATRMKTKKIHRVPLSDQSLKLLKKMLRFGNQGLVFPGQKNGQPLSDATMLQLLRRIHPDGISVHGFRSTFRDWTSECTTHDSNICEMALAHTIENKTEAAYRRGDLLVRRAELMSDWGAYCDKTQSRQPSSSE